MSHAQRFLEHLDDLEKRLAALDARLSDPEVLANPAQLRKAGKERAEVEEIVIKLRRYKAMEARLAEAREILAASADRDMSELAAAEIAECEAALPGLEREITELLFPADPNDSKDVIMEIRAGTGGEEAALFAGELYRAYSRFAERRGWQMEVLSTSETGIGGLKEVVLSLSGRGAYGLMKYESGVHRVQRVPATEGSGRIHTSAATVAVLPEAEDVDVDIQEKDLRVDVYRSSGPGGQGVNTTDSAVRITHLPTNLVVTCQDGRSQIKNRAQAMKILRSRLLDHKIREQEEARRTSRRSQVSTGDRSAKIRTYNFPQGRVTDHRINFSLYRLPDVMEGDFEELLEALHAAAVEERLQEAEAGKGEPGAAGGR
jgi:peptide chain release factor 1